MKGEKEEQEIINKEELAKKEFEIYPFNEESMKCDEEINKLYTIKNWSDMFYSSKSKLIKNRFLEIISKSEYSKFFEGLDYEYGINGKPQDIQKAFEIYKQQADNTTDTLSMYKMYHIYRNEFHKFNLEKNRILEKFYLFKSFSYLSNNEIEKYSYLLNRFFIPLEVQMNFFYEDKELTKFDKLIEHLNKYYYIYKINKDDLILIEAVITFEYKNNKVKTFALLKGLIDKNSLEALYKIGIFTIKGGLKSDKFFDVLVQEDYYRSYCDYAIYLYTEKKDYKKALKLLKEASLHGILRANYLYYDIFLNCLDFTKIEINKEFENDLLFVFNTLINDIVMDGAYSYFEFFYLRKICVKHWNIKTLIDSNFDSYIRDFMQILLDITASSSSEEEIKSKKELIKSIHLRDDFFTEYHLTSGILCYNGIENVLNIDLQKSLTKIQISFDNAKSKSYKRICYSYIRKIKQKLNKKDNKLIPDSEIEETNKKLFDLYNTSIDKDSISDLSSTFFYYFSKIYREKWGNPGNELMEYLFLKKASECTINMPGTGTIITYYRKYKSMIHEKKNLGNYLNQINNIKDSEGYGDDNSICPICYENKRNTIVLPCRHLFCDSCTKKIMEKSECPICRGIILVNYALEENNHCGDNNNEIKNES